MDIKQQICERKKEKDTVILAHYYVDGEIQEIADFVGDSYALAKEAAAVEQKNILFCGVKFMGESAKLLNPNKHVYLSAEDADCPMAHMVTPEQIRAVREKHPNAAVVCYINSTAEIKAESDVCVTSSNAVRVVKAIEAEEIFFIPDSHLAHFVAEAVPEKKFIFHDGYCPVHQQMKKNALEEAKEKYPNALVLTHPECSDEILKLSDYIGSTADIIRFARENEAKEFIIATETGVFHQLEKENPEKKFYAVTECQICPDMKKSTLEQVNYILEHLDEQKELELSERVMEQAKRPLEKMLLLAK